MADKTWKRHERETAAIVGGQRQPNIGTRQEDVKHPLFSFQVKHRKTMPVWFTKAVDQARGDANNKIPIAVFCLSRQGIKTRRYFVIDEEAWMDLHGDPT